MYPVLIAACTMAHIAVVSRLVLRTWDRHLAFLLGALSLRYLLSAFPDVTHPPVVAGLSINAIASLAVTATGMAVVAGPYFRASMLLPFYVFLGFVLVSGLLNGELGGLATAASRLLYLLVMQCAMLGALVRNGARTVFATLLAAFIAPVGLQWISIVLRAPKNSSGEADAWQSLDDAGTSYVGPYGHESGFSMILLTLLLVLMFWQTPRRMLYWLMVALAFAGLAYANYRTAILAALPLLFSLILTNSYRAVVPRQGAVVTLAMALAALSILAVVAAGSERVQERFAGVVAVFDLDLLSGPEHFTSSDRDLLTGRVYIWSRYLDALGAAHLPQQLVGFGPEAWQQTFTVYAHNTFVSCLYEYGFVGLALLLLYWVYNVVCALRVRDGATSIRLLGTYAGFTLLSCATMPLYQIEGVILFALLNGTTMYEVSRGRRVDEPGSGPAARHPPGHRAWWSPVRPRERARPGLSGRGQGV